MGAAPQAVDPDPRWQADEQERQELDDVQRRDLEHTCVQDEDRRERQGKSADLRAELADRLGRPELDEVRMPPEAPARPELHDPLVTSGAVRGAGARSMRTSPLTVFTNSSTSGASSGSSTGASESSSSELVEPLTVFAST